MALTDAFYEAVQTEATLRVRIMMRDSLLVDPTFNEFREMEKVAESMDGLYEEHDGKEFVEDRSLWDDDYMDNVMVKVLSNFSHERVNHLKEVVRYLRPVSQQTNNTAQTKSKSSEHKTSYQEEKQRCQRRGDYRGATIGLGAGAGAVVCGGVAALAGATAVGVLGSAAAGAAVGGVVASFIVSEDK